MKIWAVNTNKKMLGKLGAEIVTKQNRVVLWERAKKPDLSPIEKGDLILSYNPQKTIIAVGYAISKRETHQNAPEWLNCSKEEWVYVDWICKCISNPIQLNNIVSKKIGMYAGSIFDWTKHIDTMKLLTEIGKIKSEDNE